MVEMDRNEGNPVLPRDPSVELRNRARMDDLYKLVVDNLDDHCIILLATDGAVVSWSKGAERITGYASADVIGRNFSFFDFPEGAPQRSAALKHARLYGRWTHEGWWVRNDGKRCWVDETIAPLIEGAELVGFIDIVRDITERRLAAEAHDEALRRERQARADLEAADRRAAFLAEASSILVASALSFEGAIRSLARLGASRLSDWCVVYSLERDGSIRPVDAAHRDPRKADRLRNLLADPLDARKTHPIFNVIQTGQSMGIDDVAAPIMDAMSSPAERSSFAREFPVVSAMFTPLIARGRVLGAIMLANSDRPYRDMDLNLADELTRRAAIAIDNARLYRAAQEANRAKSDFLAVVSHELRTPLNAIMGYSDILDAGISGAVTQEQHRQLAKVRASARHLLQLIEEILSYARLESGGVELELERTTIHDIMDGAAAAMEFMAQSKNLELRLHFPQGDPPFWIDAPKARQILVNLLSNAVKFTDRGAVELTGSVENDQVRFDVHDTGIGMSREQVRRIFDPFVQGEPPTTRRAGGTGLGLSVARRFARLLDGDITVQSALGEGSTFSVRLPLRSENASTR
jgi:PAS domain S-box-containing protein